MKNHWGHDKKRELQIDSLSISLEYTLHSSLVFPDLVNQDFGISASEYGQPTNEFKQRAPRVLLEMRDYELTLVSIGFCRVSVNNSTVPYKT